MSLRTELDRYMRQQLVDARFERMESLASDTAGSTSDIASAVSRMAAVADDSLPTIVEHLAATADRLGGIEEMLANPAETAAAELYRNGTYALTQGWHEDAVSDLGEATSRYRYNPRSWFNLGLALQQSGSHSDAAEAYAKSARYGAKAEPELAAAAVLLAAYIHRKEGRAEQSRPVLAEYARSLGRCAELFLALGIHHDEVEGLAQALTIAPFLAMDANSSNPTGVRAAMDALATRGDSPMSRLAHIKAAQEKLELLLENFPLGSVETHDSGVLLPSDLFEQFMASYHAIRPELSTIADIVEGVRNAKEQHQQELLDAEREEVTSTQNLSRVVAENEALTDFIKSSTEQLVSLRASLPRVDRVGGASFEIQAARMDELVDSLREKLKDARLQRSELDARAKRLGHQQGKQKLGRQKLRIGLGPP